MITRILRPAARIPFVGPLGRTLYQKLFKGEGRPCDINNGHLKGMRYVRFAWSTGNQEMVETNWETDFPEAFIREATGRNSFWDIGANWGYYVLLASRILAPGGRILAIEPHPRTARELAAQINLNAVNATVLRFAISDHPGTTHFTATGGSQVQHITDGSDPGSIMVPLTTIDLLAAEHPAPDVIKLDVEGAELDALRGGMATLAMHTPTLLIEVHAEENNAAIYDLLSPLGYRYYTCAGTLIEDRSYRHHIVARV